MNFDEILNIENQVASAEYEERPYYSQMYNDYIAKENRKEQAKEMPFVFFYEDVIATTLNYDFQQNLGEQIYKDASDDALSCLEICNEFRKLGTITVYNWLQNALKFSDNIVLHYLQEVCKETPKKYDDAGVEKSRYIQLSAKQCSISIAGHCLKELYELRNKNEHRTKTHPDGRQELIRPKKGQARQTVGKIFPIALKKILETYKSMKSD